MEDSHILTHLQRRYATMLGELKDCDERKERLTADLAAMEAVMRLYRSDWNGDGVAPRRPSYGHRYLRQGQGIQTALDVLREAARPMKVREIVEEVMVRRGIAKTEGAVKSLDSTIRYCLEARVGDGVVVATEQPKRFAVAL